MSDGFAASLRAFVGRWCAAPLEVGDGNTEQEIAAAERALGGALPASVRTWFRLLGRRVRGVQDQLLTLDDSVSSRTHPRWPDRRWASLRCAPVFMENQGNWGLAVPLDVSAASPPTWMRPDPAPYESTPWPCHSFEHVALSMLTSETLHGAGRGEGPLGPLRDGAEGSFVWAHRRPLRSPPIRLPAVPHFGRYRGQDDAIVRVLESDEDDDRVQVRDLQWVASTPEAARRLRETNELPPPERPTPGLHIGHSSR